MRSGIGEGHLSVEAITSFIQWSAKLSFFAFQITIDGLPGQTSTTSAFFEGQYLPLTPLSPVQCLLMALELVKKQSDLEEELQP